MNKISLLCPTRERIEKCHTMIQSIVDTATNPERLDLVFYVDDDDPVREEYRQLFRSFGTTKIGRVVGMVGEPISVSKSWNKIAALSRGDVMMMSNDDLEYKTRGWDTRIDEEVLNYPDDIYVMWFNDGHNKACTFPFVSRKWYETLGYFTPGIFEFLANDTWIQRIGAEVGRTKCINDVLVEHHHVGYGKGEKDNTYRRNYESDKIQKDKALFYSDECTAMWKKDAQKIKEVMV